MLMFHLRQGEHSAGEVQQGQPADAQIYFQVPIIFGDVKYMGTLSYIHLFWYFLMLIFISTLIYTGPLVSKTT